MTAPAFRTRSFPEAPSTPCGSHSRDRMTRTPVFRQFSTRRGSALTIEDRMKPEARTPERRRRDAQLAPKWKVIPPLPRRLKMAPVKSGEVSPMEHADAVIARRTPGAIIQRGVSGKSRRVCSWAQESRARPRPIAPEFPKYPDFPEFAPPRQPLVAAGAHDKASGHAFDRCPLSTVNPAPCSPLTRRSSLRRHYFPFATAGTQIAHDAPDRPWLDDPDIARRDRRGDPED